MLEDRRMPKPTRLPTTLVLLVTALASPVAAQSRPAPAGEFTAGWAGFVDDATIDHATVGVAARWYVTPRLSIGPEVVYMVGPDSDRDLFFTGKLVFDILPPRAGGRPVVPYVVADGGFFRHTGRVGTGTFTSHEGAASGGGGVRFWLGDRVYVAPELRVGWELHTRVTATVGFRLGE
jgi:hypothetical protein